MGAGRVTVLDTPSQARPAPLAAPGPPVHDLLRVEDLRVSFRTHGHATEVVKGVSFRVPAGKTVALVGESGSGKSVISQSIMGLLPRNGRVTTGRILFVPEGEPAPVDLATLDRDGPVKIGRAHV